MGMQDILKLSVAERLFMVEAIWDSIADDAKTQNMELSDETKKMLDERMKAHNENPTAGSSWEEVKSRLLNRK